MRPSAAVGVPTRLLPQDPEAAGSGPHPLLRRSPGAGAAVLESCPQKKLECIGEGAVWKEEQCPVPWGTLSLHL